MAEENNNGQIAKEILAFLLGAGMRATPAARAAGILGSVSGASRSAPSIPGMSDAASQFMAKQYPTEFTPGSTHDYDVVYAPKPDTVKGPYQNMNYLGRINKSVIDEAGVMQDIDLHNRTITKYLRPGMNPKEKHLALMRGLEEEKNLPQFWNESKSRRPFSVSSSAVSAIRLTPDARIEVQWKNKPTWYTFRQFPNTYEASLEVKKLLQADSIGRALMPYQRKGVPINYKTPGLSWWNKPNYDGAMAHH